MPLENDAIGDVFDDLPGPQKHAGGRPQLDIDIAAVERAATIGCTRQEIAAVIGVSRATLYNHMATDPLIAEAIERGADKGKATLRRLQWKGAHDGNPTMLIWLGKQLLGQRDQHQIDGQMNIGVVNGRLADRIARLADAGDAAEVPGPADDGGNRGT